MGVVRGKKEIFVFIIVVVVNGVSLGKLSCNREKGKGKMLLMVKRKGTEK